MLGGGLTFRDNINCAIVTVDCQHCTETRVSNPLQTKPIAFVPISSMAITTIGGQSNGSARPIDGMPILNTSRTDGFLGLTVDYKPLSTSGYVGETARSFLDFGNRNALANATPETVTSVALTAGDWDVSAICGFGGAALTGTALYAGISPTTNVLPSDYGDNIWDTGLMPTANASSYIVIPSYRVSLTSSATRYLVAQANFSGGSTGAFGRISATRVKPYSTGLIGRVTGILVGG